MHRVLDSISQQEVLTFVKKLRKPWSTFVAVTLADGETIVGHPGGSRPQPTQGEDRLSEPNFAQLHLTLDTWHFLADGYLIISYRDLYREVRFYIPLEDIAGIRQIRINQPIYGRDAYYQESPMDGPSLLDEYLSHFPEDERSLRASIRAQRSKALEARQRVRLQEFEKQKLTWESAEEPAGQGFEELLEEPAEYRSRELAVRRFVERDFEDLEFNVLERKLISLLRSTAIRTARRHHYQIDLLPLGILYKLVSTLTFTGDFEPRPGERLYVDWDYVSRNREGLNGAGFGFIVSLSLNWDTSQAGAAKRLAKKPLTKISDVCIRHDKLTLIRGHVAFLEVPGSAVEHTTIASGHKLSIDGGTWRAAIICALPIVKPPDDGTPWVLAYWKEGGDEVPFEMLDASVIPLDIFASVHSGKLATSFGNAECFLKVHYAQAARGDPPVWKGTMS
jgi:hypothetical protein